MLSGLLGGGDSLSSQPLPRWTKWGKGTSSGGKDTWKSTEIWNILVYLGRVSRIVPRERRIRNMGWGWGGPAGR